MYIRENTQEQTSLIPSNFCTIIFCPAIPLTAVQMFKGERCFRANVDYLRTCTKCRQLGFWEVHQARRLAATDRLLRLRPLLHLRPLHSATSIVRLHRWYIIFILIL
jgi:hypothetical protein